MATREFPVVGQLSNVAKLVEIFKEKFEPHGLIVKATPDLVQIDGNENLVETATWWFDGFIIGMNYQADVARNMTLDDVLNIDNPS